MSEKKSQKPPIAMLLLVAVAGIVVMFNKHQEAKEKEEYLASEQYHIDKKEEERRKQEKKEAQAKEDAEIAERLLAQMSAEEFNSIQIGMTYQQVLDIAGNGEAVYKSRKVSETDYGNMVITFVEFELVEGGSVSLGFDGQVVYSKIAN